MVAVSKLVTILPLCRTHIASFHSGVTSTAVAVLVATLRGHPLQYGHESLPLYATINVFTSSSYQRPPL